MSFYYSIAFPKRELFALRYIKESFETKSTSEESRVYNMTAKLITSNNQSPTRRKAPNPYKLATAEDSRSVPEHNIPGKPGERIFAFA